MPCHGFVSGAVSDGLDGKTQPGPSWSLVSLTADQETGASATVCITHEDVEPRYAECFPHEWELLVTWSVFNGSLSIKYKVSNTGTAGVMPFSIGSLISLKYPFVGSPDCEAFKRGLLRGSATSEYCINEALCLDGEANARPEIAEGLPLDTPATCSGSVLARRAPLNHNLHTWN